MEPYIKEKKERTNSLSRHIKPKHLNPFVILWSIYLAISVGLKFLYENWVYTLIALGILLAVIILYLLIFKMIVYNRKKKIYEHSSFYKDTNIPYNIQLKKQFSSFEVLTYNRIKRKLNSKTKYLLNVSWPCNTTNKTIDLMVFHESGIYVLNLIDYKGSIYGDIEDDLWNYSCKSRKKSQIDNPIIENKNIVEKLEHFEFSFTPEVLCSKRVKVTQILEEIVTLNKFFEIVNSKPILPKKELYYMDTIYETMKQYVFKQEHENKSYTKNKEDNEEKGYVMY